jgi:hypothetical protein
MIAIIAARVPLHPTSFAAPCCPTLLTTLPGVVISQFWGSFSYSTLPYLVSTVTLQCHRHVTSALAQKRSPKLPHATKLRCLPANIPPVAYMASNALQVGSVASPTSRKAVDFYGGVDVRIRHGSTLRAPNYCDGE